MILTKEMVIDIIKSHIKDYDDRAKIGHSRGEDAYVEMMLERKIVLKWLLQDIEDIESLDDHAPFYDKDLFEVNK